MLNGQKTFISNGQLGDIVIVVARTDPAAGHRGISLLVVERGMPGFSRGPQPGQAKREACPGRDAATDWRTHPMAPKMARALGSLVRGGGCW